VAEMHEGATSPQEPDQAGTTEVGHPREDTRQSVCCEPQ
jgi:hypothetical protein